MTGGRLLNLRHVRQEHAYGCVIASLAMIAGETYADVLAEYPWVVQGDGGCDLDTVSFDFLWRRGFAFQLVYPWLPNRARTGEETPDQIEARRRKPWPPEPWAPAHICLVETSQSHAVVMLADGSVLDPLDPRPRALAEYKRVINVRGVWDVA